MGRYDYETELNTIELKKKLELLLELSNVIVYKKNKKKIVQARKRIKKYIESL